MASTSNTTSRFQASIWPSICKIPTASLLALQIEHVLPDWSDPHARLWQHGSLQGLECYCLIHGIHLLCREHHEDLRCKPREQDRNWCTSISSSRFYSAAESEQDQQYVLMHWENALPWCGYVLMYHEFWGSLCCKIYLADGAHGSADYWPLSVDRKGPLCRWLIYGSM